MVAVIFQTLRQAASRNVSFTTPVKFMFSKKATKIDEIFIFDLILSLCSKCQIDGGYFDNFCGLLRKHELYTFICISTVECL
jgi:hypothetical protein